MPIKKSQFENYNQFLEQYYKNAGLDSSNVIGTTQRGSLTGAEMQSNVINLNEAAIARQREDTNWQRDVAGMQAAGINPALVYAGGHTPGSSTSGASAVGSSNNISQLSGLPIQEVIAAMKAPLEMKIMKHQDEMAEAKNNAEVGNIVADTELKKHQAEGLSNQNEWFADTRSLEKDFLALRNQGAQKANDLTDAQITNARAMLPVIEEQLNNLQQDTGVKIMEQLYKSASIEQITRMMPYQMALLSAQTEQAQAAAALAIVQEAYQQKLIDDGYIDALCEQMKQQAVASGAAANQAEINAAIAEFKHALRTGHAFDSMPKWIRWLPNSIVAGFVNAVEIAGPVVGPALGFVAAGRALRARTPQGRVNSNSRYSYSPANADIFYDGIPTE